jgi:Zn finger protein HypA/HybF involved in hydrogenase expression
MTTMPIHVALCMDCESEWPSPAPLTCCPGCKSEDMVRETVQVRTRMAEIKKQLRQEYLKKRYVCVSEDSVTYRRMLK